MRASHQVTTSRLSPGNVSVKPWLNTPDSTPNFLWITTQSGNIVQISYDWYVLSLPHVFSQSYSPLARRTGCKLSRQSPRFRPRPRQDGCPGCSQGRAGCCLQEYGKRRYIRGTGKAGNDHCSVHRTSANRIQLPRQSSSSPLRMSSSFLSSP